MQQPWTEVPALVAVYDAECAGRRDHDFYLEQMETLQPRRVVDLGCGTGVLAVALRALGCSVVGVDPAAAMLAVARRRPGADGVEWVHGSIAEVASGSADLVVMTGHVAQYFVTDDEWSTVLAGIHRVVGPGGHLMFETRNPGRDWVNRWTEARTVATYPHPDGGTFTAWVDVVDVAGTATSFTTTCVGTTILPNGDRFEVPETLRFRSLDEVQAGLVRAGFDVHASWGDWGGEPVSSTRDELVVLARAR